MVTIASLQAKVGVEGVAQSAAQLAVFDKGLGASAANVTALGTRGSAAMAGLASATTANSVAQARLTAATATASAAQAKLVAATASAAAATGTGTTTAAASAAAQTRLAAATTANSIAQARLAETAALASAAQARLAATSTAAGTATSRLGLASVGAGAAQMGMSVASAAAQVALISLAAAAVAVGAGIGASVMAAARFEQTMSGVKAVSGATAEEMNNLSALAMQLGKDTVFSAAQAGTALEELVKGGVSIADILNGAAKATVNLATAGGVDLATAAEIAANAMSMFSLKGTDMAHVSDLVAGAANASSLSVSDFRLSLQQVGAVANLTGQSIDSTAVAISLMGAAGIRGSDAGTSLKQMLVTLQPATATARAMFDQLGITVNGSGNKFIDAAGKYKSMRDVAEVLRTSLAGYTDAEREAALQTMFGTDAIRAGAVMAAGGSAAYDAMAASMGKVTAESVGLERMNNLAGDFENLKGTVETLAISFGQSLTPELRTVTQEGTTLLNEVITVMPGLIDIAREALGTMAEQANTLANEALYALYIAGETIDVMWGEMSAAAAPIVGVINGIAGAAAQATSYFNAAAAAIHNFLAAFGMAPTGVYDPVGSWLGGQLSDNQIGDPLNIARNKASAQAATAAASWGRPDDSAYGGGAAFASKQPSAVDNAKQAIDDSIASVYADAKARTNAIASETAKVKVIAARGAGGNVWDPSPSTAKPPAAPAPYRAPLVTGGGGGGGGGGSDKAANEAEAAAKRLAAIMLDEKQLIRDMGQEADKTMTKIADINTKLGKDIAKATADTAKAIADAGKAAEKSLSDLAKSEAINVDATNRRNSLDARLTGEDLIRGRRRSDEDDLWTYQRALLAAKTDKERADLLAQRNDSIEVLVYRRQREDEDAAWRKQQEAAKNALELQLHQEDLARQRAAILEERDLKIKSLNEELTQKIADLKTTALEAIAAQIVESEGRLKAMKEGFWDKLTEAARPGLKSLADEIDKQIGARMAQLQALSGMLGSGPLPEPAPGETPAAGGTPTPTGGTTSVNGVPYRMASTITRTAGGTTIIVNAAGSVLAERDLVQLIRSGIAKVDARNGDLR